MVFFHGARKIKGYLLRAKLYPSEQSLGSRKWNNIECAPLFSSTVTSEICKINYYFNCGSKGLVFSIKYPTSKLQYASQIGDAFCKGWNNYRHCIGKAEMGEECKRKYLREHFLQDDFQGFFNDA